MNNIRCKLCGGKGVIAIKKEKGNRGYVQKVFICNNCGKGTKIRR